MKKMLAVLMVLVMVMGLLGTALAYDEEITFQGISWGSSFEETIKAMVEKGYISDTTIETVGGIEGLSAFYYMGSGYNYYLKENDKGIDLGPEKDVARVLDSVAIGDPLENKLAKKIAGYDVGEISFGYAKNETDTSLISAYIRLKYDFEEYKEVYSDLKDKLTAVYGECQEGKKEDLVGYMVPCYAWIGKNNTCVWLYADMGYVLLIYGTLDAENILNTYLTATPTEVPVDSSDTSGL